MYRVGVSATTVGDHRGRITNALDEALVSDP